MFYYKWLVMEFLVSQYLDLAIKAKGTNCQGKRDQLSGKH